MKTLFIHAKYTGTPEIAKEIIEKLPKRIGLVTTIQFTHCLNDIKSQLEKLSKSAVPADFEHAQKFSISDISKEVFIGEGNQGNNGQILGCDTSSAMSIEKKVSAFLYIGTGEFHPIGIALATNKEVFTFNPLTNIFSKIETQKIEKYKKRKNASYLKFLSSGRIGLIVSLKNGQNNLKKTFELKKRLKDKRCYIFIADTFDFTQLENFPFIECWVNTACPRIDEDINCVNLNDILMSKNCLH